MNETFLRGLRAGVTAAVAAAVLYAAPARAQTAPTFISATAVGVSSITVSWTGDTMTVYGVVSSTGGLLSSTMTAQTAYAATIVGYSTNTLVSYFVQASSGAASQTYAGPSIYTLAAAPTGSTLLQTNGTQSTLSWQTNGNPTSSPQTYYNVDWFVSGSTAIVFSTAPAVILGTATATIDNLPSGQVVYFEVQAINGNGIGSTFDIELSTTIATINGQNAISSGTYALGVSSIQWYWSASTGAINYQLFEDSGVAASPLLGPNQLGYIQTGLTPNTTYQDYVVSYGVRSSTNSAPFGRYTLAAATTGLTLVSLSTPTASATLSWGPNGNPPGTLYQMEWWTKLTSTVTVSTGSTTGVLYNLSGGSTIYFTVQAINGEGILSGYDATLYTATPSTAFPVGIINVPTGYEGTITFVLPTSVVSMTFSSNTFTVPVNFTVQEPPSNFIPPSAPSGFSPTGTPISYLVQALDANGLPRSPTLPIYTTVRYTSGEVNNVDPGTLSLAYDDPAHGWTALAASRAPLNDAIVTVTTSLGEYQVFGVSAADDLSGITVGPNPLRPTQVAGQLMTFRNLPQGARVRIFTYLGEKVADIAADGSGTAAWNGLNAAGHVVASGVYIAVIQGAGVKKLMRVAVER